VAADPVWVGEPAGSLILKWLESYDSHNTRRAYQRDLHAWLKFLIDAGAADPLDIPAHLVDVWIGQAAGLAAATETSVTRRVAAVKSFYRFVAAQGAILRSPFGGCPYCGH
jgi:site-specific recombinase XerD